MAVDAELHHEVGGKAGTGRRVAGCDAHVVVAAGHHGVAGAQADECRVAALGVEAFLEIFGTGKARVELAGGVAGAGGVGWHRCVAGLLVDHAAEEAAGLGGCAEGCLDGEGFAGGWREAGVAVGAEGCRLDGAVFGDVSGCVTGTGHAGAVAWVGWVVVGFDAFQAAGASPGLEARVGAGVVVTGRTPAVEMAGACEVECCVGCRVGCKAAPGAEGKAAHEVGGTACGDCFQDALATGGVAVEMGGGGYEDRVFGQVGFAGAGVGTHEVEAADGAGLVAADAGDVVQAHLKASGGGDVAQRVAGLGGAGDGRAEFGVVEQAVEGAVGRASLAAGRDGNAAEG